MMDEKLSAAVTNICTILGGALLLYPIIDQATKTLAPEIEKLTTGESLPLLTERISQSDQKTEHHEQTSTPAEKECPMETK